MPKPPDNEPQTIHYHQRRPIAEGIQPFIVWHDQFKTAVLANAAGLNRSKQREQRKK